MGKFRTTLLGILALTSVYEYGWPSPSLTFEGAVLAHLVTGILLILLVLPFLPKLFRNTSLASRLGWALLLGGAAFGAVLIYTGDLVNDTQYLYTHIGLCVGGIALLAADWAGRRGWLSGGLGRAGLRFALVAAAVAGIAYGAWWERTVPWNNASRIKNPAMAPENMDEEGAGAKAPFFPSSATIANRKEISEDYFLESESCKECHADTFREWDDSAHHFSSFNNQWYRKAIDYMQGTIGVKSSKWCAGCHDEALLFSGNFDQPAQNIEHTPAASAGVGCLVCHSIVEVPSTMGQGGYVLEYPPLARMAVSRNPVVHGLADFLIKLNPEPHRRTFLKPFMHERNEVAEYCSLCHKVHLDVPVNNYRWVRGFDDYDNWQASGVSGLGARSFYYPPQPMVCTDCHMPLVPSKDFGNKGGLIPSHRFIAANTALPYENREKKQLDDTIQFLQSDKVRVDIFAMTPETAPLEGQGTVAPAAPGIATTFGVGEESAFVAPKAGVSTAASFATLTAPLRRARGTVEPGETVRVDVVVRTLGVGHFFPGGTVDAFDLWLELKAVDAKGHILFWSGAPEDGGNGPVDPSAHFYRALLIDGHGNPIDKRNAWAERATVYVHLIPPGAADTVHYRIHIPKDVTGPIRLTAKLNYRKFEWYFTQFAFAGAPDPNQKPKPAVGPGYDDTHYVFTGSTADDSGKRKGIPNPPIVVMASDHVELNVAPAKAPLPKPQIVPNADDWQRWNDYGIGFLLQGDLKAAYAAFEEVSKIAPDRPDGWNNMGRAQLQEGNLNEAAQLFRHALEVKPTLASAHFFTAQVLRNQGKYAQAIPEYRTALAQYPNDRVVRDELGRTYFLERHYEQAIQEFRKTLAIDPEDLEANYNLMLCYTGLGQPQISHQFEVRYLRFKADEASQSLIGPYVREHPNANTERQPVHEHDSVPLKYISSAGIYDPPAPAGGYE
jgi:Tfp pilus assembly protein PilF